MPRPAGTVAQRRRAVCAAVICAILEFFDFVCYAFFAVQIGHAFFPATEPNVSLLMAVAVFGMGFIARPVGSVVIGHYADRVGRRPALLLSATLMTAGTLGLALTPGYAAIGLAAPLLVIAWRLLQGFALGGEMGPSIAFLLEIAPPGRRASYVAWQIAGQGIATVLAGLLGFVLSACLAPSDMAEWGWRVPFAIGALLVPVALYLRATMPETLHLPATPAAPVERRRALWRDKSVLLGVGVIAGGTVSTYVGTYMTTYATTVLKFPPSAGIGVTLAVGLATVAGALAGGRLADRIGRWPLMFWPRLLTAVLCVPAFMLLASSPNMATLLGVAAGLAFLTAANGSGVLTAICELFPPERRAMALALVYSVGVSLFGGSTQLLVTWLVRETGNQIAPAWYVAAVSAVAVLVTVCLPETRAAPVPAAQPGAARQAVL